MPSNQADYNPLAIEEWKQWLQNTGIYGSGGDYFGAGRVPAFADIDSFNSATGKVLSRSILSPILSDSSSVYELGSQKLLLEGFFKICNSLNPLDSISLLF